MAPNTINADVGFDVPSDVDDDNELIDCNYKFKGAYGQKTSAEGKGKFILTNYDEKDDKWSNDIDLHIVTPFEKADDIKINSKDLVIFPVDDKKLIDVSLSTFLKKNILYKVIFIFKHIFIDFNQEKCCNSRRDLQL